MAILSSETVAPMSGSRGIQESAILTSHVEKPAELVLIEWIMAEVVALARGFCCVRAWTGAHCMSALDHPKETQNDSTKWLQAFGSNVCGHEVIWKTGAGPPEGHHWTLAGSSSVCLLSKRVCRQCSQRGTALCSAISRQTRGLCEDAFSAWPLTLSSHTSSCPN